MAGGERVEWLRELAGLLADQRQVMLDRDVDGFLHVARRLEKLFSRLPELLDAPPTPHERAWLQDVARTNRANLRLLRSLREPLEQLASVAREHDTTVVINAQA